VGVCVAFDLQSFWRSPTKSVEQYGPDATFLRCPANQSREKAEKFSQKKVKGCKRAHSASSASPMSFLHELQQRSALLKKTGMTAEKHNKEASKRFTDFSCANGTTLPTSPDPKIICE
jgi:hypothetical protein